ncbi:unnamed protein product [Leptosia nina]|uniref:Lipase n=1 Tax=Leptosia nina TaxID=320188 RepID=A0AAV1JYD3_9NEOP
MDEWNPGDKASISEENWTRDLFLHKLMHGLQTSDFDWSDFSAEQTDRTIKELDKRLGTSIHPKEDYKVPRAATRKWTFKKGKAQTLGYTSEEYEVVTEDGYILTLFRIRGNKDPVLLVHGFLDSSDTYIIRGNRSLVANLAQNDYDVWSANVRGGRYSRRHLRLNPDGDAMFWDFSYHEIGYYDLPAIIDFILDRTGKDQLSAIGHSQGNTIFYVLGSTRPVYNKKVRVMIALSPICYFNNVKPPSSTVLKSVPLISNVLLKTGEEEVFGDKTVLRLALRYFCGCKECYNICARGVFFPIGGNDPDEIEPDFFPTIIEHYPTGSSRKNTVHLAQGYLNSFSQFDYGSKNNEVYGQSYPPKYDLRKVSMRIVLLAGRNDGLASLKDVETLRDRLPNVVEYKVLDYKLMNHIDFVWGRNMDKYLFPYIINALNRSY